MKFSSVIRIDVLDIGKMSLIMGANLLLIIIPTPAYYLVMYGLAFAMSCLVISLYHMAGASVLVLLLVLYVLACG